MAELIAHPRASWLDPETGAVVPARDALERAAAGRVVLLGETHDIAEIHRWQLHVAAFLKMLRPRLAMGFEMFPRRVQPVLDAWVAGDLSTQGFLLRSEWAEVWRFDPELYLPLFHFCRQQQVPMLALNCHRPLVTRVGQLGLEAIPVEDRDGVSPAAPATAAYRAYIQRLMGTASRPNFDLDRFMRAQQTWDRAFACRIADHLASAHEDTLVVGIIGRGHLEYGHGTPYQLADLGIDDCAVLLPTDRDGHDLAEISGIAQGLFRLDSPDPPPQRPGLRAA